MEAIAEQWEKIGIKLDVKEIERGLGADMSQANLKPMFTWNNDGSEHLFTFPGHVFAFDKGSDSGGLYGLWFQSNGEDGEEPPDYMKEIMSKWRKAFGVPRDERIELAKDIWRIAADEVYTIGVVGLGAASMGVRVVKTDMGNIPSRQYNSPDGKTPSISRTMTFFWQSAENRNPQPLVGVY
jgi:peptide/nickel transport system substrate-binding protein